MIRKTVITVIALLTMATLQAPSAQISEDMVKSSIQ